MVDRVEDASSTRQGHRGHYDVSNDFYKLFLDNKYIFYTCADFHFDSIISEKPQVNFLTPQFLTRFLMDPLAVINGQR